MDYGAISNMTDDASNLFYIKAYYGNDVIHVCDVCDMTNEE